jgi:hypothetical protein
MKVGDLVRFAHEDKIVVDMHDYGVGLIITLLPTLYKSETKFGVLWENPVWVMKDGLSVVYPQELEVVSVGI